MRQANDVGGSKTWPGDPSVPKGRSENAKGGRHIMVRDFRRTSGGSGPDESTMGTSLSLKGTKN
jgi:hypothetical protein